MTANLYYETAHKLVLKDGREVFVRQLDAGDAESMLVYLKKTAQETHFLMRLPEEAIYTLEKEREILKNTRESKQTFMLGALDPDGRVVGNVGVFQIGDRFKVRHRASLGIAVVQEYWNTGLGTTLINGAIDLTRKAGYEQLELGVFSDNSSAIHLYRKLGFQEVGRMPNAFKLPDGSYADEIMMVLQFTSAHPVDGSSVLSEKVN